MFKVNGRKYKDCTRHTVSALLLWQNLFQLLSYLILRLNDEPVVEWGDQDDY